MPNLAPIRRFAGERSTLLAWQFCALAGQVWAVHLARQGHSSVADGLSNLCMALAFGSAFWALLRPRLNRTTRSLAVGCLAVTPALMSRATDPLLFTGFDEQLHMRTLGDILGSHRLFEGNPVLEISPLYPGLEVVTTLLHQFGLPVMVAATAVIIVARLALVAVLCDAVEQLAESPRAGGLAVAVYATSPQFVWFNSQFSYQTLSLPLALAAISLIGRARQSDHPLPLFGGATACLLALAMTHHVTSFLTAAFLLIWAFTERGAAKLRVAYGALAAVASTVAWAVVQRSTLEQYFGPFFHDLTAELEGGARRHTFQDTAGTATPIFDKFLLLYYAAALSLIVLALMLLTLRWQRRREHGLHYWNPQLLVMALANVIPILLVARVVPKGVEIFTRSSSFLFLPLSFVVVNYLRRLDWWNVALGDRPADRPEAEPEPSNRRRVVAQLVATVLASGMFLGGYVLGSGPNWARLPGAYMPAADSRSMDAENLAAAHWAGQALPPGSRVGADRVSSVLLAARAGLWPVYEGLDGVKTPELYVAKYWGLEETDKASALKIRFLYVDGRMSSALAPFGYYFATGEVDAGKQLTDAQLTKFDQVPAIKLLYRHGQISIYDLKGLGLSEFKSGWLGPTPPVRRVNQVAVGLAVGLLLGWAIRSQYWPRIVAQAGRLRDVFGPALTAAVGLASVCLVSGTLLLMHVWLSPVLIATAALVVLAIYPDRGTAILRRCGAAISRRRLLNAALVALPLLVITGFAIREAANEDVTRVQQILNDPAAVHVSPN